MLAHDVDAVGVKTLQQVKLLLEKGSMTAQGLYFSRPVPASTVPAYVNSCFSNKAQGKDQTFSSK